MGSFFVDTNVLSKTIAPPLGVNGLTASTLIHSFNFLIIYEISFNNTVHRDYKSPLVYHRLKKVTKYF